MKILILIFGFFFFNFKRDSIYLYKVFIFQKIQNIDNININNNNNNDDSINNNSTFNKNGFKKIDKIFTLNDLNKNSN
jgi:hypothetical protein